MQESLPAQRRLPKATQETIRYKNMTKEHKKELTESISTGDWVNIKRALDTLEKHQECMTVYASKNLSAWLEYSVYRGRFNKEQRSKRYPIYMWPKSTRTSRSIVSLANPEQLLKYLNFPSASYMLNGVSSELLWSRIARTERSSMLRQAFEQGANISKRYR